MIFFDFAAVLGLILVAAVLVVFCCTLFANQNEKRNSLSLAIMTIAYLILSFLIIHRSSISSFYSQFGLGKSFFFGGTVVGLAAILTIAVVATLVFKLAQMFVIKSLSDYYLAAVVQFVLVFLLATALTIIPVVFKIFQEDGLPFRQRLLGDIGIGVLIGALVHFAIEARKNYDN
jgi:hypothetical protein